MKTIYDFKEQSQIISPQLIYYEDLIRGNMQAMVKMAGNADRLWPHVKTHKMAALVRMQMNEAGITRFKCATIAEAQMTAEERAEKVVLSYPLIGPNIARFLTLCRMYPETEFFAIGDDTSQICLLSEAAVNEKMCVNVLMDVDMGQHRTGVPFEKIVAYYEEWSHLAGITMRGMHCYDGHRHEHFFEERLKKAQEGDRIAAKAKAVLEQKGLDCSIMIYGGSPSFPVHQELTEGYLSPGTILIHDKGYAEEFPDLGCTPAGVVLTRVISRPAENRMTLDMGTKAVASDPPHERASVVGMEYARTVIHNEEHWVLEVPEDHVRDIPCVGTELFAIPTHICPTSALYPSVPVVKNGRLKEWWEVTARNRVLTI